MMSFNIEWMNAWFTAGSGPAAFREGLRRVRNSGAVHHSEYEAQLQNGGKFREDRPSDHRPVSVRLEY